MQTAVVTSSEDLEQILALQRSNLEVSLDPSEVAKQGFVTVAHTRESLQAMHRWAPSIIAKDGEDLAGYALTMVNEARSAVPLLAPMFRHLDALVLRGRPLAEQRFYVMGQICVAKAYRGQGVFDALYGEHRARFRDRFDLLVTEIAVRNERSLRAHQRVGFEVISRYRDATDDWAVVAWDWRAGTA